MKKEIVIDPVVLYSIADNIEAACVRCHAAKNPLVAAGHRVVMGGMIDALEKRYKNAGVDVSSTVSVIKSTCTPCLKDKRKEPIIQLRVGCIIRGGLD